MAPGRTSFLAVVPITMQWCRTGKNAEKKQLLNAQPQTGTSVFSFAEAQGSSWKRRREVCKSQKGRQLWGLSSGHVWLRHSELTAVMVTGTRSRQRNQPTLQQAAEWTRWMRRTGNKWHGGRRVMGGRGSWRENNQDTLYTHMELSKNK